MTYVNILFKTFSGELLQMSVKSDDTFKTLAQKLVLAEPQLFKCPSFVKMNRISDKKDEEEWEEGEMVSVFYDPEPQTYKIHDNGGVPFIVEVRDETISIYYADVDEKEDEYEVVKGEMFKETSYEKVWIGDNDLNDYNYEKDPGNSILVHLYGYPLHIDFTPWGFASLIF